VDINRTYDSYTNGVNGQYTRSIRTEMDSNFKLTQVGHNFKVDSALRDYGNTACSEQILKARWNVQIINAGTLDTYDYYCDHDVSVAIN